MPACRRANLHSRINDETVGTVGHDGARGAIGLLGQERHPAARTNRPPRLQSHSGSASPSDFESLDQAMGGGIAPRGVSQTAQATGIVETVPAYRRRPVP